MMELHFSALYTSLGDGELKSSIPHPFDENGLLFLLFDLTHNLKNIYNWLNRTYFSIPSGHQPLIPQDGIKSKLPTYMAVICKGGS